LHLSARGFNAARRINHKIRTRAFFRIGQLARQRFGDDAALIGFGTDRGTVAAASDWDGMMEIREEVNFTRGRIIVRGKHVTRGKSLCQEAANGSVVSTSNVRSN
jgi:hypothetical protein